MPRGYLVHFVLGLCAGALVAWAQVNLWRTRRMLKEAQRLHDHALLEFEKWRKALDDLHAEREELRRSRALLGLSR